mgnify:FL=1
MGLSCKVIMHKKTIRRAQDTEKAESVDPALVTALCAYVMKYSRYAVW